MNNDEARKRDEQLVSEGWVRRFSSEEPRLTEMKETYEGMGFEVLVEPGMLGDDSECKSCFSTEGFQERYKTIYTRGSSAGDDESDLFE
jgi:hypothetical protein